MARRGEVESIRDLVDIARFADMVQLGSGFAAVVFPDDAVFVLEPLFLQGEPVGLVGTCFGKEVNFETCFAEDVEGVEGFGDEETGFLAVWLQRRVG